MKENIVAKLTAKDDKYACALADKIISLLLPLAGATIARATPEIRLATFAIASGTIALVFLPASSSLIDFFGDWNQFTVDLEIALFHFSVLSAPAAGRAEETKGLWHCGTQT